MLRFLSSLLDIEGFLVNIRSKCFIKINKMENFNKNCVSFRYLRLIKLSDNWSIISQYLSYDDQIVKNYILLSLIKEIRKF